MQKMDEMTIITRAFIFIFCLCCCCVSSAKEETPWRVRRSAKTRDDHNDVTAEHLSLHIHSRGAGEEPIVLDLREEHLEFTDIPVIIGRRKTMQNWKNTFSSNEYSIYTNDDETTGILSLKLPNNHHVYMGRYRTPDGTEYALEPSTKSQQEGDTHYSGHRVKRQTTDDVGGSRLATEVEEEAAGAMDDDYTITELNDTEPVITDLQGRRLGPQYEWDVSNLQDPDRAGAEETVYVVQLLIAVDYAIYTKWSRFVEASGVASADEEAIRAIYQYYTYIAHAVDLRFRSIQVTDFSMQVELTGIYIATTPEDSPWSEAATESDPESGATFTHSDTALDNFEEWLSDNKDALPVCDVGALFTGYIPFTRGEDGEIIPISGLGDISGVCTFRRASLNMDKGMFGSIQTLAHEIGHNLGGTHDGASTGCNRDDQYIMTPYPSLETGPRRLNQYTFSECSIRQFNQHLGYLTLIKANCLLSREPPPLPENEYERRLAIPPGQFLSLDTQCRVMHGNTSFYCGGDINDKRLCEKLYCYNPVRGGCLWSRPEERAAEGSTCGNKQWCEKGQCMHNESAPATRDYCVSGDNRGSLPGNLSCDHIHQTHKHLCYRADYRRHCCLTCLELEDTTWPDCSYGDRQDWCNALTQPADCYTPSRQENCCHLCRSMEQAQLGAICLYGDRATWCQNVTADQCYDVADTCCQTCETFSNGNRDCQYGDKAAWCTILPPYGCYVGIDRDLCCDYCSIAYQPIKYCEYGDRGPNCTLRDCLDPSMVDHCCQTCRDYRNSSHYVTLGTTTPPPTITSTRGTASTSPIITALTTSMNVNAGCVDQHAFCGSMHQFECYILNVECCQTCSTVRTNDPGCEFGDRYDWCTYLSLNRGDCLNSVHNLQDCCGTCKELGVTMSTTTQTTRLTTPSTPVQTVLPDLTSGTAPQVEFTSWTTLWHAVFTTITVASVTSTSPVTSPKHFRTSATKAATTRQDSSRTTDVPSTSSGPRVVEELTLQDETAPSSTETQSTGYISTASTKDDDHDNEYSTTSRYEAPSQRMDSSIAASSTTSSTSSPTASSTTSSTTSSTSSPTASSTTSSTTSYTTSSTSSPTASSTTSSATSSATSDVSQITDQQLVLKERVCEADRRTYCKSLRPRLCYQPRYRDLCCRTCQRYRTPIGNCEYGDQDTGCPRADSLLLDCDDPQTREACCTVCWQQRTIHNCAGDRSDICPHLLNMHCYMPELQAECCQTCRDKQVQVLGCEFGDKASWCPSLQPWDCYNNGTRAICCHICHRYQLNHPSQVVSCRYGNHASLDVCSARTAYRCYDPMFRTTCCAMCQAVDSLVQIHGCRYGDRVPGCTRATCSDPANHEACCYTCHGAT